MNLLEIRREFKVLSGRYDLVLEDDTDNGANILINEGSKWLDRVIKIQKTYASYLEIITAGTYYVQFPFCRAIKEVWATTSEGRWQLEKMRLQDLMASYLTEVPAEIENGTPIYYSPTLTRYIPEGVDLTAFATYIQTVSITGYEYNAIILSSPVDRDTLIDVRGIFYSKYLTEDDDENYWSSVHPILLIMAAARHSHVIAGNTPMLKILDTELRNELTSLGMDLVEEIISEADQMEG